MYRCGLCNAVTAKGRPRLTHVLLRPDGNIHREVSVCEDCKTELDVGVPYAALRSAFLPKRPALDLAGTIGPDRVGGDDVMML